jgi:YHS domain-containing protein
MQTNLNIMLCITFGGAVAAAMQLTPGEKPREPTTCLRGLDPVALTQGREVPGDNGVSLIRGRYRYLFGSIENRDLFERQPDRYAIQLGGGCGRMGPLSGVGSPDRFLVHGGRIYIFASDQCMNGFKSAPERHIESDDPPPTGSDAELARGQELVERALVGFGGAAKVDAVTSLELKRIRTYQADGEDKEQTTIERFAFPHSFRLDQVWHSGSATDLVQGDSGYRIDRDGSWPMDDIVRREFIKAFLRNPLALLKARGQPGFRAVAGGHGKVGDQPVEWLAIGLDGATSILGIEPATGRVLSIRFRGRAPAAIGDVTRTFSDFRPVDGVIVPFTVATAYNDNPAGPARSFAAVTVNPRFDERLFSSQE